MKRLIPLLLAAVIAAHSATAEEKKEVSIEKYDSLAFGIAGLHIGNDIGGGYDLTTPYWNDFALRLSYVEHETSFGPAGNRYNDYSMVGLGIVVAFDDIRSGLRPYGDAGIVKVLDNSKLSSEKRTGYYGIVGLERHLLGPYLGGFASIRLGIGWIRTYSKADRIPGEPVYAHGSAISSGAVFYF